MTTAADVFMDPAALAALLGIPEATLKRWRTVGTGPDYFVTGRHVRYRRQDVDAWLETRRRGSTTGRAS